jgi:hypothetical protein
MHVDKFSSENLNNGVTGWDGGQNGCMHHNVNENVLFSISYCFTINVGRQR